MHTLIRDVFFALTGGLGAFTASCVNSHAQATTAPPDAVWVVNLEGAAANFKLTNATVLSLAEPAGLGRNASARVEIHCGNGAHCAKLHLTMESLPAKAEVHLVENTVATESVARYLVLGNSFDETHGGTLVIAQEGSNNSVRFPLKNLDAVPPTTDVLRTDNPEEVTKPLADLLSSSACKDLDASGFGDDFVVSATGNVLGRPQRPSNEGDRIRVTVYADERLAPLLLVTRKSAFREVRVSNIFGGEVKLTAAAALFKKNLANGRTENWKCQSRSFVLSDFNPGKGVVEIQALTDVGRSSVGSFDFTINALYTGAFTIGAVRTQASSPTFGTTARTRNVTNASGTSVRVTDTVVTRTTETGDRMLYVLTYVPFIWGERDIKVKPTHWLHRFNPMLGVVLNDLPNNGLLGLNYDLLSRVHFTAGVHAARITDLDDRSLQMVGQPIGDASVATTKRWVFSKFIGVSVDLIAGVDFLKTALSASSPAP